jgi:hypothetical protein
LILLMVEVSVALVWWSVRVGRSEDSGKPLVSGDGRRNRCDLKCPDNHDGYF